ncbi:hypothetical protein CONPUDRAFT_93606 [Coniophora puteana RWD-64-598 SS2]|uniref:Uncharacterized protein n=1 Tax=Coniophora puteana (strain RWD-64-598) TaxID=741705 RepID=A0A5M3M7H4_CONPW|nr:uncharacterized protein CONPUDRAFT_93606 [Coniophora puteana RWD-64-598 SS2]EIW74775.1 hypothetical protein CONPUDRAFT_93606 [Coniophora puteana RWD-64-598 SS2]
MTANLSSGVLVAALKNGDIVLWTGLDGFLNDSTEATVASIPIASPRIRLRRTDSILDNPDLHSISITHLDAEYATLLVAYADQPYLYRLHVNLVTKAVTTYLFGEDSEGYVSAVEAVLTPTASLSASPETKERALVLVGDQLGFISIFDWSSFTESSSTTAQSTISPINTSPPRASSASAPSLILPTHKFQAFDNGSVTAIAWSPTVVVVGSSRGSTTVYDAITLVPLRYFVSPASRPRAGGAWAGVSQILLERESVCIGVGGRVMSWVVGPVPGKDSRHWKGSSRKHAGKGSSRAIATSKGFSQYEMLKDIKESRKELESERAYAQRVYGREREQRTGLDVLGLSEQEAVAYVLMLSRDEEERKRRQQMQASSVDEGVFLGDFDDVPQAGPSLSSAWQRAGGSDSGRHRERHKERPGPRVEAPRTNEKVQVSPPYVAEPREAGASAISAALSVSASAANNSNSNSGSGSDASTPPATGSDQDHFPPVSSSASASESGRSFSRSPASGPGFGYGAALSMSPAASRSVSHSSAVSGVSSSVESSRSASAWTTPLRSSSIPVTPPAQNRNQNQRLAAMEYSGPSNSGRRQAAPRSVSGSSFAGSASPSSFSSVAARGGMSLLSAEMARLGRGEGAENAGVEAGGAGGSVAESGGGSAGGGGVEEEMDDDLRFAIELSLAEARSREEAGHTSGR